MSLGVSANKNPVSYAPMTHGALFSKRPMRVVPLCSRPVTMATRPPLFFASRDAFVSVALLTVGGCEDDVDAAYQWRATTRRLANARADMTRV